MKTLAAGVAAAAVLLVSGCSSSSEDTGATTSAAATSAAATSTAATSSAAAKGEALSADTFHLHDGFVKAVEDGKGMTAIFGTLENHTDKDVHLVGFKADVDAKMFQIHEVVDGVMQEKADGITVPAGGTFVLKPGGDHLMIMGLTGAIEAGDTVDATLEFDDGETVDLKSIPVRQIGAGEEDYGDLEGHDHEGMEGHKHEGMEGHKHEGADSGMKHDDHGAMQTETPAPTEAGK